MNASSGDRIGVKCQRLRVSKNSAEWQDPECPFDAPRRGSTEADDRLHGRAVKEPLIQVDIFRLKSAFSCGLECQWSRKWPLRTCAAEDHATFNDLFLNARSWCAFVRDDDPDFLGCSRVSPRVQLEPHRLRLVPDPLEPPARRAGR